MTSSISEVRLTENKLNRNALFTVFLGERTAEASDPISGPLRMLRGTLSTSLKHRMKHYAIRYLFMT